MILPNVTYKFKIQMKDKFLNWTNEEETEPITSLFLLNLVICTINMKLFFFYILSTIKH
jgi:hypothetical protein